MGGRSPRRGESKINSKRNQGLGLRHHSSQLIHWKKTLKYFLKYIWHNHSLYFILFYFFCLLQCKGFWPIGNQKRMQMVAKVTEKSLQTLPFYFTEAHSTLLALPIEVRLINLRHIKAFGLQYN